MKDSGTLLIAAALMLVIGVFWMGVYWRIVDPLLRKLLGKLLGVKIHMGEQNIWQINDGGVDDVNWRNLFVRPLQIVALMTAGLIPLVVVVVIMVKVFG
ncbi:MAG: hypothetical protein K8L97_05310 [Anaerolineae bacterium]|nr:hypothetical protein [Anaerolineae bacterium]